MCSHHSFVRLMNQASKGPAGFIGSLPAQTVIPKAPRPQSGKTEGIEIDALAGVITILFDLGHGNDNRFGPKVHP